MKNGLLMGFSAKQLNYNKRLVHSYRKTPQLEVVRSKDPNRIYLYPGEHEAYQRRIGKRLNGKRFFHSSPTPFAKNHSIFAQSIFAEQVPSHRREWLWQARRVKERQLVELPQNEGGHKPSQEERNNIASMEFCDICKRYGIEEVIGYNLLNLNSKYEQVSLIYKAYEILAKSYYREKRQYLSDIAEAEALYQHQIAHSEQTNQHEKKRAKDKVRAKQILSEVEDELNREFESYCR